MIHRTRQGGPPSGAPEAEREVIRLGDIWVEYSSELPTAAELDTHLNPPKQPLPLDAEELYDMLTSKGVLSAGDRPRSKP